jgi:glucosamine--fructose-6-phosphate aminotransferase (isomerizing)
VTTHLERELREQPSALHRLLANQRGSAERVAALFRRADVEYVLIASRGSSSNAARYAQYVLGRAHRVPVAFATPSLYTLYGQPPRLDGALVIGISQSGRSPDGKEVLEEAKRQGRPTVAITNDVSSPLAGAADEVLALEAGEELAVAATKTYLNSLGAIALLFAVSTDDSEALHELEHIPANVALQIERSWDDAQRLDRLGELNGGTVVARGVNYATAFETALKIRELSGLLFEAYSAADLMHGPIAAVGTGWPVLAIAPRGPAFDSMTTALDAFRERGARLVVVSDDDRALARADAAMPLWTRVPEWLSPLVAVVPGQLAALRLAQLRGIDLDAPLGLHKITLTR